MNFDLPLLPSQAEFVSDTSTRELALIAGYGAGKSKALAYKVITLAALNANYQGALMSPTFNMLNRTMTPTLLETLDHLGIEYLYRKTDAFVDIKLSKTVSTRVHLLSLENWRRAAGLNLAFACVDEIDIGTDIEETHAAYKMIQSRIRYGKVFQIACASTPEGYGFLWSTFVRDTSPYKRIIHASTYENFYLAPGYIDSLLRDYPANLVEAYVDGRFVNLRNAGVYAGFDRVLNGTDKTLASFYEKEILDIGVDFNIGKMAATVAIIDDKRRPHFVAEHIGARDTVELCEQLTEAYPNRQMRIYPDASGASASTNSSESDLEIIRSNKNMRVCALTKNPYIRDRVAAVNGMILNGKKERRLFVNVDKCPKLTEALEIQSYDDNGKPDKSKGLDHVVDAAGYFMHFKFAVRGAGTLRQLD